MLNIGVVTEIFEKISVTTNNKLRGYSEPAYRLRGGPLRMTTIFLVSS